MASSCLQQFRQLTSCCLLTSPTNKNSKQKLIKQTPELGELLRVAKTYSPTLVRGFSVGNTSVVDKKSWLEVCDTKHRYGANLRTYYKEWKKNNQNDNDSTSSSSFWEWLEDLDDSIEIEGVSRSKLERETVRYCYTDAEREAFALSITSNGLLKHHLSGALVDTQQDSWIFVLQNGVLFAGRKETDTIPRFHHTSFVAGECVQTAGMMVVENGVIQKIYPHSGHYRPSDEQLLILLDFLQRNQVNLEQVEVDVQRMQKVYRVRIDGVLIRKIKNVHLWNGLRVLCFLRVKHFAWEIKLFHELVCCVKLKHKKNTHRTVPSTLAQRMC